jgi:hypothetical protein
MKCARSIESNLRAPFLRRASSGSLDVELISGRIYSFVDVDGGNADTDVFYSALEVVTANRYVVIHRQFYEGGAFGLLDRKSGAFTKFDGYPILSPDRRWIAVADVDQNSETLQIFEVTDGVFRLALDAHPLKWWPTEVEWRSPTSLIYKRSSYRSDSLQVDSVKATLQFDGKAWR